MPMHIRTLRIQIDWSAAHFLAVTDLKKKAQHRVVCGRQPCQACGEVQALQGSFGMHIVAGMR